MTNNSNLQHENVVCRIDEFGVASLTLNREDKSNAFDDEMIQLMTEHLHSLRNNDEIRCLIIRAEGKHFSAGADLNWMKSMANKSHDENLKDAEQLADLMYQLDNFPHPTISLVLGSAFGGALGLICCSDIAVATEDANFCFSEVKLGLIPATIGPYICRAIGARHARRYMLTAERFDSAMALQMGLVHKVVDSLHKQDEFVNELIQLLMRNSPEAVKQTKSLCLQCEKKPIDKELIQFTSQLIADARVSVQGQEGLHAFFDKRAPNWVNRPREHS